MSNYEWESNAEYKTLPPIDVGDIVHLKMSDVFVYLVKSIVTEISDSEIKAVVQAIFDWNKEGHVTGGEVTQLVGKDFGFTTEVVHRVIKSNKRTVVDEGNNNE